MLGSLCLTAVFALFGSLFGLFDFFRLVFLNDLELCRLGPQGDAKVATDFVFDLDG